MGTGARILIVEADSVRGTELAMELELRGCRVVLRDAVSRAGSAGWEGPDPQAVVVQADAPDAFDLVADWEAHPARPKVILIGGEPGLGYSAPGAIHPEEVAEVLARILFLGPRPPRLRRRRQDADRPARFPRASVGPLSGPAALSDDGDSIPDENLLMAPTRRLRRKE